MMRCPGKNVWFTIGSPNTYGSGSFALIAEGCSKLVRYRPRKISVAIGSSYPLISTGGATRSGCTSISFTTQSASVPLVDATRCTVGSPESFIGSFSGSVT